MSAFFGALGSFSRTFGTTMNARCRSRMFYREGAEVPDRARGGARRPEHPDVGLHAAGRRREPAPADVPPLPEAAQADDGRSTSCTTTTSTRRWSRRSNLQLHARGGAEARARRAGAARRRLHRRAAARVQRALDRSAIRPRASARAPTRTAAPTTSTRTCCSTTTASTTTSARWPTSSGHTMQSYYSNKTQPYRDRRAIRSSSPRSRRRSTRRCSSTTC